MTAVGEHLARRDRLFQERDAAQAGGRGYSRLVRSLRLVLPILATALLVLAVIWPQLGVQRFVQQDVLSLDASALQSDEISMRSAQLIGADEEGRPFRLTAAEARQSDKGAEAVILTLPTGKIDLGQGAHITMRADSGFYDRAAQTLRLNGDVQIDHANGYRLTSSEAHVDLAAGRAFGNQPISGDGPEGQLSGDGFEILEKGQTIRVLGKSRLVLTDTPDGL